MLDLVVSALIPDAKLPSIMDLERWPGGTDPQNGSLLSKEDHPSRHAPHAEEALRTFKQQAYGHAERL